MRISDRSNFRSERLQVMANMPAVLPGRGVDELFQK